VLLPSTLTISVPVVRLDNRLYRRTEAPIAVPTIAATATIEPFTRLPALGTVDFGGGGVLLVPWVPLFGVVVGRVAGDVVEVRLPIGVLTIVEVIDVDGTAGGVEEIAAVFVGVVTGVEVDVVNGQQGR